MAKFCPNCGSPVKEGNLFCANCGTKLNTAPAAPVEAATVAAPAVEPAATPVVPVTEPVVAPAEAAPVATPVVPVVEPTPVVEPVAATVAAPVTEPVAATVAEPAPVAEPVYEAEPVPAVEQVPEAAAAPVYEPVPDTNSVPVAAVEPTPAPSPAPFTAAGSTAPVSAEPMPFEAPSGPVAAPVAVEPKTEAPKKKNIGGLIALFVSVGVVALALIVIGIFVVINGGLGIGGTVLDRIERKDKVDSGKKYAIYDEDFNDYIVEARWWDYDSTMDKPGMYNTDTETLAFSIEVNEDAENDVYYAYYFSKDKEFDKDDMKEPVYSNTIPPEEYGDGKAFYNIDYSKKIQKGYYVVIVASDKSLKKPYVVAYADVK